MDILIEQQLCETVFLAAKKNALKKAVFSKSKDKTIIKAVVSPISLGGSTCLQAEIFHADNKATHKNIALKEQDIAVLLDIVNSFSQINVYTREGECEYRVSSKGKRVLLGGDKLIRKLSSAADGTPVTAANNRKKSYILDGSEPFLTELGVSDKSGRVYDKKQSKFRQINRFLELVRDVEDKLPTGKIRICDLCCGKSYLSFAVYHYFANVKKYEVSMTGIDLKADVIEYCSEVAKRVGFDGLEFICGDINDYHTDTLPSLVISLHACDVATDIVLKKAAQWKADVILSTPCCHHELNHSIDCEALSFITDYSMLRQKLCDAATDALRLKRLEAQGYTTAALELIDPDETPKNIMLRAVRKKNFDENSDAAKKAREEYLAAKKFLCGDADKYHF
ncbi:MAG: SAM-dependent methyltransferase [Ruminococcaceae bacterium]|nr:SAM-dependent methyltransferase [Oscillospiraceae bacterium]